MLEQMTSRRLPDGRKQLGVWARSSVKAEGWDWHPTVGRGWLTSPEGDILWMGDWVENALHDEGEKSMLDVYLREQANPSKYLFLMNQGAVTALADTVIMTGITEAQTPGANGYARQQILAADWGAPALDSGDMQTTGATKTFGPNSSASAWSVSHTGMTTASTGTGGLLVLSVPLSSVQSVAQNIAFTHQLSWKQQ